MDAIISAGIIFLIFYCPMAFGSVHILSFTFMEIIVFLLGLCWLIKRINSNRANSMMNNNSTICLSIIKTPLNYLVLLFLVFIIIQILPLPALWIKNFSPGVFLIYSKSLSVIPAFITLSIYKYGTKMGFFKILAYVGIFFLIINWAETKGKIKALIISFILIGSFESIYGILEYLGGHNHIWWFKKIYHIESVTGTYLNRNHLAGLLEMAIPLAFGFFIALTTSRKNRKSNNNIGGIRGFILSFKLDSFKAKKLLLIFSIAIMTLALILSGSRGGIISLAIAILCMNLLLVFQKGDKKYLITALLIGLIALTYGFYVRFDTTIERFEKISQDSMYRLRYAKPSIDIIKDYPLLGTGFGTFSEICWKYQDAKDEGRMIRYAHNDWAELGAEMGMLGLGLGAFTFLFCLGYFFYLWKRRGNSFSVGIGLGGMGAILSLGLHSFTDFNMKIPANALLICIVAGITHVVLKSHHRDWSGNRHNGYDRRNRYDGYYRRNGLGRIEDGGERMEDGGSRIEEKGSRRKDFSIQDGLGRQDSTDNDRILINIPSYLRWPLVLSLGGGFIFLVMLVGRPYLADRITPVWPNDTIKSREPTIEGICASISYDGGNDKYYDLLANAIEYKDEKSDEKSVNLSKDKVDYVFDSVKDKDARETGLADDLVYLARKKAVQLNPANPFYHLKLGWSILEKLEEGVDDKDKEAIITLAEKEFNNAVYFMPEGSDINFSVGCYWLWKLKVAEGAGEYQEAFDRMVNHFQKAYRINKWYKGKIKQRIIKYYPVQGILDKIFSNPGV